ncbi:hypothetical protein [Mucilaginibacter sp.]
MFNKLLSQLSLLSIILLSYKSSAQSRLPDLQLKPDLSFIDKIDLDTKINADSAFRLLSLWNHYPNLEKTGVNYVYHFSDPVFGDIPLQVYIPESYNHLHKNRCALLLHGAVSRSQFSDIDSLARYDNDTLFSALKHADYIIIRPVADSRNKKFDWVVNMQAGRNGDGPNLTFRTLVIITVSLKKILNIDDDRVFAFGHSDGSDGAVGLAVFQPNAFAGVVAYNSMLNNIFAKDFYIRNTFGMPMYAVHSDLDDLRPIQQAQAIIDSLKPYNKLLTYKEYKGYQHEDKHLNIDMPSAVKFMAGLHRNAFPSEVRWETNYDTIYNTCQWLKVSRIDTAGKQASWYHSLNFKAYNKRTKGYFPVNYYNYAEGRASAVVATYQNNIFKITTSKVEGIEIAVSPKMVNLKRPVSIYINGLKKFEGIVKPDKKYITHNFKNNFDRQQLWVTAIKIKAD